MGLIHRTAGADRTERHANVQALRQADAALHAHHTTDENDPQYQQLNTTANQAAAKVSRWRGGTR